MGRWTVYHAGDTVRYEGMIDRLRIFNIDVALLPINGRAPQWRVLGNLSGLEAAELAHRVVHLRSGEVVEMRTNAQPTPPEDITW